VSVNNIRISSRRLRDQIRGALFVELSPWQLLVLAAVLGVLSAASLFDWDFVIGRHAFWQFPRGIIGGSASDNDMAAPLAAYLYYVQSPWTLPLFDLAGLDAPSGVNAIYTDFVPIVPLIGKLIHSATGAVVNAYGVYFFLCFALPGVMMTLILIAAQMRYAAAAIVASIFANSAPILLWRWGQVPMMAQYLLIGALSLYLLSVRKQSWRGLATIWIAFMGLTYLTNIYLFAMVGIVWICAVLQRRLNGLSTTWELLGSGLLTLAFMFTIIAIGGQLSSKGPLPFTPDYGIFSMNLLSPFAPQQSGFFPGLGGVIDATGGQYEGFNYLGLGLLFASLLVLPLEMSWLKRNLKRHLFILIAFAALTLFAISNHAFAGHWSVFDLPLPLYIHRVFGIFRSSGRFFWLICYTHIAVVLILGFRRARFPTALFLIGAAVVQLLDVQPLRAQIIASIANGPGSANFDPGELARVVARARRIEVVPSYQCSNWNRELMRWNVELMLAAARQKIPINSVYLARYTYGVGLRDVIRKPSRTGEILAAHRDEYCKREFELARTGGRPGDVVVLLSDLPRADMDPGVECWPLSRARFCRKE
jgi:hypothetical protein